MAKNQIHKIEITLEGTEEMFKKFLDAYEAAAHEYDEEINLKEQGLPKCMWDFGDDPSSWILQHYFSAIYWPITDYLNNKQEAQNES